MTLRRIAGFGPAFVVAVALFLLWQLSVQTGLVATNILPSPTSIITALVANWDVIALQTTQTALETVLGLIIATVTGLAFAVLLDTSEWIRRAIYPLLITSQTIPMVALAPLFIIWFGYGLSPKIIVVTLYCFFPISVACADGLMGTDPELIRLLKSMGASRWQIFTMVRLPNALPSFFSGLRIAATYSVTGAIVGEYVAAYQGLGLYMRLAASAQRIILVFAAIVVITVLSLLLFGLVSLIERIALPWYQRSFNRL
jgi:ABC-type nitrate/sulfonate/bicarbonate transport system permease component